MTWTLPSPEEIADRLAGGFEGALETAERQVDARNPNTVLGVIGRVTAAELFLVWLYQRALAEDLMPDTAAAEALERHANIWGITRLPAAAAVGSVSVAGANGTIIPAGTEVTSTGGLTYLTTASATVASGTATLAIRAEAGGAGYNLATGAVLSLTSPVAGLLPQSATVLAPGIAGGTDVEADDALRTRLLARIRQPPHGGAAFDYEAWAQAASADVSQVAVYGGWAGLGTVGVVIAMTGPRTPNAEELALVDAYIQARRPVTATVAVIAATLTPVDITVALSPDTVATRAAVEAALETFFASEAALGGTLYRSRISEAISAAAGEYAHALTVPAADITFADAALPVLGEITYGTL